jgi:hypothetical protein
VAEASESTTGHLRLTRAQADATVTLRQGQRSRKPVLDADEDDAVPGGIAFVPFNLVVGHGDFRAVRNLDLAVRDDRNVMAAFDLKDVGLGSALQGADI